MAKCIQINLNKILIGTKYENKKVKIGVALSGGRDSIALCHLLKTLGEDIVAINVEHGIRGESSVNDSNFVKEFCKKNNIPLLFKSVDSIKYSKDNQLTIEQAARELRYNFFNELLDEKKVDLIALAHHADDQAETILMRILRGTGVKGLIGMKVYSHRFIRPLLEYSREDIDNYIKENNLEYVDDETNKDTKYTRNFLREELETLKTKYPSLVESFARLSRNALEMDEYLNHQLKEVEFDGEEAKVKLEYLVEKPIAKKMIMGACHKLKVYQDIEERHYDLIFDLINKENGKRLELTHNLVVYKDENYLVFSLNKENKKINTIFKEGQIEDFKIEIIDVINKDELIKDKSALYLDVDKVNKDAIIRNREEGDFIHKFGGGTKSLGDYLTDKKIPLRNRENLLVLASGKEIYAVFGVDISSSVKIDEKTQKAYKISRK